MLAARLIKEQGIDVIGLKFKIPFSGNTNQNFADSGIDIREVDIGGDFLKMLENPRYGYGVNMNPCIDCKIMMLNKARELMGQYDAKFIITGEVLGQRPMSQNKEALATIVKRAGLEGLVLRPLSAQLLAETVPEREGWIKRRDLLNFSGRGRRQQIKLAQDFGIKEYAQPAGGCLLTDPEFSKRLKEIIVHKELTLSNIELLKVGRHFRISPNAKLIVGRNEKENEKLVSLAGKDDYLFFPCADLAGPTSLGRGEFNKELIALSCAITCRYCDLNGNLDAEIVYRRIPEKENKALRTSPITELELLKVRI